MKNVENWKPTKFLLRDGELIANPDSEHLAPASRLVTTLVARKYQEFVPQYCRGDLLDLGCGHVPFFELYRPYIKSVTCVDWADSYHSNDFLDITCDLSRELPIENVSHDTIILSDVLEHLPIPVLFWTEAFRVLRPGGHILLNVPFMYWLHEKPYDFYRYTCFALEKFADDAGFETVLLEAIGGVPEVLTDVVSKSLTVFGRPGTLIAVLLQKTCLLMGRTRIGRAASRRSAESYPLGYYMVVRKPLEPSSGTLSP